MKIINQFMSLLLSAALLTQGIPFAYAQNASDEEKLAPTEVLKADNGCSTQPVNGTCCSTMELVGNSCVLKAPLDTSLTNCNSISDCTSGKGCLPQTSKDIFSNITNEKERLNKQLELEAFLGNRANGSFCKTNLDCASYNCGPEAGKMTLKAESVCQEKLVCRSLHEGEALVGGVKCGLGLEPENGVCVKRYEPIVPVGEFDPEGKEIFKVYQEKACDMEFNDELKQAGLIAIKAIRGMEWYFGTMDTATPECTSGAPKQLRALGEGFQNARKPLLYNLSTSLNNIDADFKKLMEASWKYGKFEVVSGNEKVEEKFVDVHTDTPEYALENISDKDLATRQSSGIDTLIMMQRRNETFMAYEQGMLGVLQSFAGKITQAGQIATTLGGCSNGKPQYKVRPFLTWQKKNWNGMDQWYMQYDVKSGGDAVNKPEVAEALALLSGQQVSEGQGAKVSAPAAFTGQHYLIDPIPFSGLGLSGSTKVLKRRSGLLGLPIFGGFEDLRKAKYLSSYAYEPLNGALLGFYKKLKSGKSSSTNLSFKLRTINSLWMKKAIRLKDPSSLAETVLKILIRYSTASSALVIRSNILKLNCY